LVTPFLRGAEKARQHFPGKAGGKGGGADQRQPRARPQQEAQSCQRPASEQRQGKAQSLRAEQVAGDHRQGEAEEHFVGVTGGCGEPGQRGKQAK